MSSPDTVLTTTLPDALRAVMRSVPSPVTVVTAATPEGEVRGMTIGSFTSLSMAPPLISFNVQRSARMSAVLAEATHFSVHVLAADQSAYSNRFAVPMLDADAQFDGIPHTLDANGVPILSDALARLDCIPFAIHPAGDHILLLGEVTNVVEPAPDRAPLLYLDRAYRHIGEPITS